MEPVTHTMELTMDDLLIMDGMAGLNEALDASLEDAGITHYATDIAYEMVAVKDGVLTVKATYTPEDL